MAQKFSKLHDVRPRIGLDRVLFVVAFAIGVVGGVALKLNGVHPFVAAGFAAAVLLGYAFLTWSSGRLQLEPEAIGDNCYYLGFLFTLSSLSVTLWQVAEPPKGSTQAELLPEIISGFGVALSSTIVGVFLRVLMMQMRPDFVASEHEARTSLTVAMRDFRGHLSSANSEMKAFTVESVQRAKERDERIRVSTEEFVESAQKQIVELHAKATQTLEQQTTQNLKTISSEAAQAFAECAGALDAPVNSLGKTLDRLQHRIASLEDSVSKTEEAVQTFNSDIEEVLPELEAVVEAFSNVVQESDGGVKKFSASLSRAATRIDTKTIPALETLEAHLRTQPRPAGPWGSAGAGSERRSGANSGGSEGTK